MFHRLLGLTAAAALLLSASAAQSATKGTFPGAAGVQVGSVSLPGTAGSNNPFTVVTFSPAFEAVPVVVVMPNSSGGDARSVRIRNVTASGFEVIQVEAPNFTGGGAAMANLSWIAALPGEYRLPLDSDPFDPDIGPRVKVGRFDTTSIVYNPAAFPLATAAEGEDASGAAAAVPNCGAPQAPAPAYGTVSFATAFPGAPVVLSMVQTMNNEGANLNTSVSPAELTGPSAPFISTSTVNIVPGGFDAALELSEVRRAVPCTGLAVPESFGYIAMDAGLDVLLYNPTSPASPVGLATAAFSDLNLDNCTGTTGQVSLLMSAPSPLPAATSFRGFFGHRSRDEVDGGWLRRCNNLTSSTGVSVSGATVTVDSQYEEDTNFDNSRTHTTLEDISVVLFSGSLVTTPVTVAAVSVQRHGQMIEVAVSTELEVGHVALQIEGRAAGGAWRQLGTALASPGQDSFEGQDYRQWFDAPDVDEVRVVDVDLRGQRRAHAPIRVGSEVGSKMTRPLIDWQRVANENSQYAVPGSRGSAQTAVARVAVDGLQRVQHAQLVAAGVDLTGTPASSVALRSSGEAVLRHVGGGDTWGAASYVEWVGKASDSRYDAARAYEIVVDPASARPVPAGAWADAGAGTRTITAEMRFETNSLYEPSSPIDNPWYDRRLSTTGAPVAVTRNFVLPNRLPGDVTVDVDLLGGLDHPESGDDHSVEILINGVVRAAHTFDGITPETVTFSVPDSGLQAANTLTLRAMRNAGHPSAVVYLDGFTVHYPASSAFIEGRSSHSELAQAAGDVLTQAGFEVQQGFSIAGSTAASVFWTDGVDGVRRSERAAGVPMLKQGVTAWVGAELGSIAQPTVAAAAAQVSPQAADYLIIAHPQFVDHLGPLIALQEGRGLTVSVARTDEIYAAYSNHERRPSAIRDYIAAQQTARYILLVGGDHVDYRGYLGNGALSFVPTFYRRADSVMAHAPDETRFTDRDGDGRPEAALGRLPVRSVPELQRLIVAIGQREAAGLPQSVLYSSGTSYGPNEQYAQNSRVMASVLPSTYAKSFALAEEIGLAQARSAVQAAIAGSVDWVSYVGHSAPNRWNFDPLITYSQVNSMVRAGAPALVAQWGCWNNYFVDPVQDSMAHALMLGSTVKASAVLGSVSLAEDAAHLALAVAFHNLVAVGALDEEPGPVKTIGEALLLAQLEMLGEDGIDSDAARSVVLFGDPAQPVRN